MFTTLLCLFACFVLGGAAADGAPASLRLLVVDAAGARIAGAQVTLMEGTRGERSLKASEIGEAVFDGVMAGRIRVDVSAPGFVSQSRTVKLSPGSNLLKLILQIAVLRQTISVAEEEQVGMTSSSGPAFATTLAADQIAELPEDPEELERVLKQMAGPGAVIRIDGFSGGRLPPKTQIASIRIRLSSYSAEDHDLGFASIDIETKVGSGGWHGSAAFAYGGDQFNARNFFAPAKEPQRARRFSCNLSGPIKRGKSSISLWMYRNFSYDSATTIGLTPSGPFAYLVRLPDEETTFSARVRHSLTRHNLSAEIQRDSQSTASIGKQDLPERLTIRRLKSNVLRVRDSAVIGHRLLNDVRIRATWLDTNSSSVSDLPSVVVNGAFAGGGAGISNDRSVRNVELKEDLAFNTGRHGIRTGIASEYADTYQVERNGRNGTFVFTNLNEFAAHHPAQYSQLISDSPVTFKHLQFGAYLQDEVRLRRNLSLSGGVRWETQNNISMRIKAAPRGGITWSPFRNARTTIRGGAGVFYQWITSELYGYVLPFAEARQSYRYVVNPGYPDWQRGGETALQLPPSVYRLDQSLGSPYLFRSSLGAQQKIGKCIFQLETRFERGVALPWANNLNQPTVDGALHNVSYGNLYDIQNGANFYRKEVYLGITGPLKIRRCTGFWSFGYTGSRSINEVDNPLSPPSTSVRRSDRGIAGDDIPHRLYGFLTLRLGNHLSLSSSFAAQSGFPYNLTTGLDDNGDNVFNDRPNGVKRNSARGTPWWSIDSRITWTTSFGEQLRDSAATLESHPDATSSGGASAGLGSRRFVLMVYLQAFNLPNHARFSGFSGVLGSPLYGRPTSAAAGRRVETGLRLSF
ncbi:MAG: carboxypeptidase-like regulatory domain-containing protein [Acidobacteriales bacterium]|nr:carboxypeptidase-like regulatory domain-containing protein [Terriglobales bacterium]